jgi:hypothetical protein
LINTNQKPKQLQQKLITQQINKADAYSFFNLLTSPELLSVVEEQLPEHRERLYPPTTTLSLFLTQCMNSDSSCQNTVNSHTVAPCVRLVVALFFYIGAGGNYAWKTNTD